MKKLVSMILLGMLLTTAAATAQVDKNAIGLRLGGGGDWGAEISYQHKLSQMNRLEADLGLYGYGFDFSAQYQWVWNLGNVPGLNWYLGAGGELGVWHNSFALGIIGDIGLEYNFPIPLQLSLDYRPGFMILPDVDFHGSMVGLGIRYKF